MVLALTRTHFGPNSTLGRLVATVTPTRPPGGYGFPESGAFLMYTLEDAVREIPGVPVSDYKIKGRTAIPEGWYTVVLDYSNRFKRVMPHLLDVPGFEGIRIHAGNTAEDTEGCILVGNKWAEVPTSVGDSTISESRVAYDALFSMMQDAVGAGEQIRIEVKGRPE